jgi:Spy/CpxP family protein refolding chaperone
MFEQSLNLSDEQAKKLEPVFREQQARMSALRTNTTLSRQERIAGFNSIREATDEKMKPHLTPEQLEKLQKSRAGARAFSHGLTNQVNKPIKDKASAEDEKKQPTKAAASTNAPAASTPNEAK